MKTPGSNSYLTISCSLSLLLIGLFIYIDMGKVDKSKNKISNFFYPAQHENKELSCNSDTVWTHGNSVISSQLDEYMSNNATILEPNTYSKIDHIHECIHDKNLYIKTSLTNFDMRENTDHLHAIINKYYAIQAALKEKNVSPREIHLSINLGN